MIRAIRPALLAAALIVHPVQGGPDPHHHGSGPHGGRVEDAGPWHAELVVGDGTVAAYLSDETGKPVPVTGFAGTAILIADGKPARIPLTPEGDRLVGRADTPLSSRAKGAVRLAAPDGRTATARFD